MIGIEGNKFTVDGGPERDADDPENAKFLESIKNYLIPEEFAEDGVHTIRIVRTSAAYRKAAAKPIPVELIALQREYMVY